MPRIKIGQRVEVWIDEGNRAGWVEGVLEKKSRNTCWARAKNGRLLLGEYPRSVRPVESGHGRY